MIKGNGKPVICREIGFVKGVVANTDIFPLYPRHKALQEVFRSLFNAGCDGVLLWSATTSVTGGSYSIVLDGVAEEFENLNTDDRPLMSLISQRNCRFNGGRTPIALIDRLAP